jgi:hypothetical protein
MHAECRALVVDLLDALVASWDQTMSPSDVQFDRDKIKLLKSAASAIPDRGALDQNTVNFYKEVFLRDLWSNGP